MKNGSGVEAGRFAPSWSGGALTQELLKAQQSPLKRAMDLILAVPVAIFIAPFFLMIFALLKIMDPGPVLFVQRRCGANGRTFECYKFRTMRVDAQERLEQLLASDPAAAAEWATFQKLRNDPRVTLIGKILRKSSLDELPQLFNILRGDMSIVGPRPITSAEIHRYGSKFHFYTAVRPGVVGLWQVNGRNSLTYDQRVAMDIDYVVNWSIWEDVKIVAKAIPVVLFARGAY
jgi:exopolysaccharide production protein ExoY